VGISICTSSKNIGSIYKHADFFKIQSDKIKRESNCIEILTKNERESLYVNYIRSKHSNLKITSTNDASKKECRLELINKESTNINTKAIDHNENSLGVGARDLTSLKTSKTQIITQENKEISINIDDSFLYLKCMVTRTGYQIELRTSSKSLSINSSFSMTKNETKEIGRFSQVDEQDDKNIKIIKNKIKSEKSKKNIFLYLKAK
jgi:hypothetical protein